MFYVASVRRPGDLCSSAKICSSEKQAKIFVNSNKNNGDFSHVQPCASKKEAQEEYDYQTQTKLGK